MTSIYDANGKYTACTVIEVEPNVVTQVKTTATDGYNALQVATGTAKEKNTSKAMMGVFTKAGVAPKHKLAEIRDCNLDKKVGDTITADIFAEGENVSVIGWAKGRGFQGVVKRHGFSGVGDKHHGQHDRQRAPGSLGGSSYPSRVFKGLRMAGQMGNNRVKVHNLKVMKVYTDKNLIVISGNIPGSKNNYVIIEGK